MINEDDVSNSMLFGGVGVFLVLLVLYLVFSRPEINKCHEKDGVILRVEGKDICIDKSSLKPVGT